MVISPLLKHLWQSTVFAVCILLFPLLVVSIASNAQSTDTTKVKTEKFDVASIRPNSTGDRGSTIGDGPGGGIQAVNITARKLITAAFDIRDFQLEGGPGWIQSDHFDIIAKQDQPDPLHPRDMTPAQRREHVRKHQERLRTLLAERFHLKVRLETEDRPGYRLTAVNGGHKLKPSVVDEKQGRSSTNSSPSRVQIQAEAASMETIRTLLSAALGSTVVDDTGITGIYDIKLQWTADEAAATAAGQESSGSIFTAIQEQLGLKLEAKKVPTKIVIIDDIQKPTEN